MVKFLLFTIYVHYILLNKLLDAFQYQYMFITLQFFMINFFYFYADVADVAAACATTVPVVFLFLLFLLLFKEQLNEEKINRKKFLLN